MTDPDAAFMLELTRGNEEAFVTLYRKYRDRIIGYCTRLLGDRAQAEEAAQDVFLKLYGARKTYEPKSRFSTFLYKIATHHCFNLRARLDRKLVRRGEALDEHPDHDASHDAAQSLHNAQLRAALTQALAKLPENQRAALVLVHHEGLSYRDAAEVVDVSESAIKSLVHRAREALTGELASWLEAAPENASEVRHAL